MSHSRRIPCSNLFGDFAVLLRAFTVQRGVATGKKDLTSGEQFSEDTLVNTAL